LVNRNQTNIKNTKNKHKQTLKTTLKTQKTTTKSNRRQPDWIVNCNSHGFEFGNGVDWNSTNGKNIIKFLFF